MRNNDKETRAIKKEFYERIRTVRVTHPFLIDIIMQMLPIHTFAWFGHPGGNALLRILGKSGILDKITSMDDFDRNHDWLYDMIETAKQISGVTPSAVDSVVVFYNYLKSNGFLEGEFKNHENSAYDAIRSTKNVTIFFEKHYTNRENTYVVHYGRDKIHPSFVNLGFHSDFLRKEVLLHYKLLSHLVDRTRQDEKFVCEIERWMGEDAANIQGYEDINGMMFANAVEAIKQELGVGTKACINAMRFIVGIFRSLIRRYPDHDFFKDNIYYNASIFTSQVIVNRLSMGYAVVITNTEKFIPGHERLLLVLNDGRKRSANGTEHDILGYDLSEITYQPYREMFANFLYRNATHAKRNFTYAKDFLVWLNQYKGLALCDNHNRKVITRKELEQYRAMVSFRAITTSSQTAAIVQIKTVLRWGIKAGFLSQEDNAFMNFVGFGNKPELSPHSISGAHVRAIREQFKKDGKDDLAIAYSGIIFDITLITDTRPGEVCSMKLSDIKFLEDGGCLYTALEKNSNGRPRTKYYTPYITKYIEDAIELGGEIRERCSRSDPFDYLFLLDNGTAYESRFQVMSQARYNTTLKDICKRAGIEEYTTGNVRDTYYTAIRKYARDKKLTDLQEALLTKHSYRVSTNSYEDIDLADIVREGKRVSLGKLEE